MLNFEEQVQLGISLMKWNVDVKDLKTIDLNSKGVPATYIYEPIRGGKSICITNKGDALVGNSAQSLEQLIEDLKKGKKTNFNNKEQSTIQKVKCPKCGNITEFDTAKVPTNIKFDYKCSNCGVLRMIKLNNSLKENDKEQSVIEYFNQYIFMIENSKDPTWEIMCQKIADELVKNLSSQGKSLHYILVKLNGLKDVDSIEQFLISQQIQLPESKKTKDSILVIFKNKLQNVKKRLEERPQGIKW